MDQEMLIKTSRNVFGTILKMLENKGMKKLDINEEELKVNFTAQGDDFPIDTYFTVLPERQVVRIASPLPFRVPEDKRVDTAIAITMVNNNLLNGSFNMDFSDGYLEFRLLEAYHESLIGPDVFDYLLSILWLSVDEYNDKLFALIKGMMTMEQFIQSINS